MGGTKRYRLVRGLGGGAGGEVFLAEDHLQGGRHVALKRLAGPMSDVERAALEREFSTLASVSLPGVASVFDFGVDDASSTGPVAFFTRAYVEGAPLDKAAASLPTDARVQLFSRAAARVRALHAAGIVHGDLKPANVIVDANGDAHLIDFGLACAFGPSARAESVGGTPAFMAPELFAGERASSLTDIYALGCTLWMLLCGAPPNTGRRTGRARNSDVPIAFPPDADATVRAVLALAQRAFASDARDRFPTVGELLAALERVVPSGADLTAEWVPPPPRGHVAFAEILRDKVAALAKGGSALLVGEAGAGKTTLLRAIKWHYQLRGWSVIELAVSAGAGVSPLASLMEQTNLLSGSGVVLAQDGVPSKWSEQWVSALARIDSAQPILLLVDDLDRAERVFGELLRLAVHNEDRVPLVVLASAQSPNATTRELCADDALSIPALEESDVRALVADALGAVDATVVSALIQQSRGLPANVIGTLRSLSTLIAPTAADVLALDVDGLATDRLNAAVHALTPLQQRIVLLCDQLDGLPDACLTPAWLGDDSVAIRRDVDRMLERGLLRRDQAGLSVNMARIAEVIGAAVGVDALAHMARGWRDAVGASDLGVVAQARLSLAARDALSAAKHVPEAVQQLRGMRAYLAAIALARRWVALTHALQEVEALSLLAELEQEAGDVDAAGATSQRVLAHANATAQQQAQARVIVARGLSVRGDFDGALSALRAVNQAAPTASRARAFRELARVHLLRGNYEAVSTDALRGLDIADASDLVRVELLTSLGMAASYQGNQAEARARYQDALNLARAAGSKRDVANTLAYLAIANQRGGDVASARDLIAESLEIARDLGDVSGMSTFSLNLGVIEFYLGNVGAAASSYESAIKLAQLAGRANTMMQARQNLAHVHIYFGLFEQGQAEADALIRDATAAGLRMIQAQATVLVADLHARQADVEAALVRYDEALRIYGELGQEREVADVHLDAAEAILDRGGPADASAAAARLAAARALIQQHDLADYALRLSLLVCRARIHSGEIDRALVDLQAVTEQARQKGARDILWRALVVAARAHEGMGASFRARRADQEAVEVLEEIALQVPREHREAFWKDPRRREVRRRAAITTLDVPDRSTHGDLRRDRLLEIIKRLASEHDLDRLLERITESAVELSGAERGFVLLVDANGKLEMRTERSADDKPLDPHAAFSRSIAEAVLIDGEPIVTVDAAADQRVNEYMSVHRLMLRSLACLPIRGRSSAVGVLYLEHRRHRGCFSDADIDVLHALADQAAIALENARLIADNAARRRELETANAALEQAKQEIEALLVARTEELEEARVALEDARAVPLLEVNRHGMIGRSAGMRRVFETIDRLTANDVPVTIVGESGTGKELVARAIHRAGTRAAGPFVVVNCAAIPEPLIESELFGHVRGAFTGADRDKQGLIARASGGTLFLDEVSEMPPKMQVDLLRVVQERSMRPVGGEQDVAVDVRIVSASNRSLDDMVQAKMFREDLYYRLNVVQVRIPPLRERRDDIPLLCEHFLRSFAKRDGKPSKRLSTEAIERLCAHRLPGNVRQLEHLLLNAWVLVDGTVIRGDHLALEGRAPVATPPIASVVLEPDTQPPAANVEEHREHERRKILESLERHAWNRVQAAAALGMPRRTFYRRLRDYSII